MQNVLEQIRRIARSTLPVLIYGETGTGKDVAASEIHERSARRGQPLVVVNCAAIPPSLLESELFGSERGAFTGASAPRKGLFSAADGGTMFLDEIGELPLSAQAALLRVLETQQVRPIGSNREIHIDVRFIAATNRNLESMVEEGRFRMDLLYRLDGISITMPPLRERSEDIEALARHFLKVAARPAESPVLGLTEEALTLLKAYPWPGNVRELRSTIARAVMYAGSESEWITEEHLPPRMHGPALNPARDAADPASQHDERELTHRGHRYEAQTLREARQEAEWDIPAAARRLGMSQRTLARTSSFHGVRRPGQLDATAARSEPEGTSTSWAEYIEEEQRRRRSFLQSVLDREHWNLSRAAARLGIHRNQLYREMSKLGMSSTSRRNESDEGSVEDNEKDTSNKAD
ncbi:sigma 54-interacting transcriptional regulator [Sorangium sp. So ce429]